MIYLISNQNFIETDEIKKGTTEQLTQFITKNTLLGLDIETNGFDPYTCKLLSWQVGDKNSQFVVDNSTVDISLFKDLFEDPSKTWIGHNLKFDLRFTLHNNVIINNVYDTYVSNLILWNGYLNIKHSLDVVAEKYVGAYLDKSVRGVIHKEGLSMRVVRYAAQDVAYLHQIREAQLKRASQIQVNNALKLNNQFVPVMAYLEYCGFKLDKNLWKEKVDKDKQNLKTLLQELNQFILDNNISRFINKQLDLFNPVLKANINWASPQQVADLFSSLGVNVDLIDKETGELKQSVGADSLKKQINSHPIIPIYIGYRELLKQVTTYGDNWFEFIHPVTKRIHTKFQQFMNTGRMSSGGKDKGTGKKWPNAQNIPSDSATRQCIIADEGNILINADYDGQETRVFANKCMDPALLKMYDEGFTDMHSYIAWHLFPEIQKIYPELTKETLTLIKNNFPEQRQTAKFAGFAIQYGGVGETIAENCNIPVSQGEKVYKDYFKAFKGIKEYFDKTYALANSRGYILYNEITHTKYFVPSGLKPGKSRNRSFNYPIQGTSADITKLAGIYYWRSLIEENLVFKCKIAIICHDEYLLEVPKELAEQEAKILKECMETAGNMFCKRIPLTATPVITNFWTH